MNSLQQTNFTFSYGNFTWWVGVVEDRFDPLKLGRLRVRVVGYHTDDKSDIPSSHLFWANPVQPITSSAMNGIGTSPTGIVEGTWVLGFFRDGDDAQDPVILGSLGGVPENKDTSKGFFDPKGIYPRDEFIGEPDTNRLARGEKIEETIVKDKQDAEDKGVQKSLNDGTWDEPATPDAREYPYNHVRETETGLIEEWDDTPDETRYHRYHPTGTFVEEHKTGDVVRHVAKDKYEVILGDDYVHVKGNVNITVDGNVNMLVNGNSRMETLGNKDEWIHGNYNIKVDGSTNLTTGNQMFLKSTFCTINGTTPALNY